ncbi:hypothetical protein B0J13DRAFT_459923, partial [Dactylonectria estremocensis]
GRDIDKQCIDAYRFIVENYTPQYEIWMFGLSKGAFIIQSVAGMINNCGIIIPKYDANGNIDRETRVECDDGYETYRSKANDDRPQSRKHTWATCITC